MRVRGFGNGFQPNIYALLHTGWIYACGKLASNLRLVNPWPIAVIEQFQEPTLPKVRLFVRHPSQINQWIELKSRGLNHEQPPPKCGHHFLPVVGKLPEGLKPENVLICLGNIAAYSFPSRGCTRKVVLYRGSFLYREGGAKNFELYGTAPIM